MIDAGGDDCPLIHKDFQYTPVEESVYPKRFFSLFALFIHKGEQCMRRRLVSVIDLWIVHRRSVDGEFLTARAPCERGAVTEVCEMCQLISYDKRKSNQGYSPALCATSMPTRSHIWLTENSACSSQRVVVTQRHGRVDALRGRGLWESGRWLFVAP